MNCVTLCDIKCVYHVVLENNCLKHLHIFTWLKQMTLGLLDKLCEIVMFIEKVVLVTTLFEISTMTVR